MLALLRNCRLLGTAAAALENLDVVLNKMETIPPSEGSEELAALLRQCGAEGSIDRARRLHSLLVRHRRDHGSYIGNQIMEMYGACGSCHDAAMVFVNMNSENRNVYTWTILMKVLAKNGHLEKALEAYHRMDVTPNRVTFIGVLGVCASLANLAEGRMVHDHIVRCGLETDLTIENSLVNMYGKCGSAKDARKVFESILEKDVISWNSIIDALASCGEPGEAMVMYRRMKQGPEGTTPNGITLMAALAGCSNLDEVDEVHSDIRMCGLQKDAIVGSKLVNVYSKCGDIAKARNFFDNMPLRVAVTWNAMISAYAQKGYYRDALCIFRWMELEGTRPDESTFLNVISCVEDLDVGRWLENRILLAGYKVQSLGAALVSMFGRLGSVDDAKRVFELCTTRDVAIWNSMLGALARNRHHGEALDLYSRRMIDVAKDDITFLNVLGACTTAADVAMVHEDVKKSKHGMSEKVANAIISSYSKCGDLESSKQLFEGLNPKRRDIISWGAMIASYTQHGHPLEALNTFKRMCNEENMKPDGHILASLARACTDLGDLKNAKFVHKHAKQSGVNTDMTVGTTMITMFAKCGSLDDAFSVFLDLPQRNVVCWSSMISALVGFGYGHEALRLLKQMDLEGVKPNAITFVSAVEACSLIGQSLNYGKALHQRIVSSGYDSHESLRTALINMYSKCGNLIEASTTFQPQGSDALEWTAMITACARHGTVERALEMVKEMELCGVSPDLVTLLSVLSICSHGGMVKQGWEYFSMMSNEYGLELRGDHFTSLVDLLGRAGWVEEAEQLVLNMPCQPDVVTWTSFLGACNMHGDVERAKRASSKLMELGEDSGPFVTIANTQLQVKAG